MIPANIRSQFIHDAAILMPKTAENPKPNAMLSPMPTPDIAKVEAAIVQLTNVFRKEQGLAAVHPNLVLRKAAEDFARYLARTGTFSHTADNRQPGDRAKAAGYEFCIVSENLASNLDFTRIRDEPTGARRRRGLEGLAWTSQEHGRAERH